MSNTQILKDLNAVSTYAKSWRTKDIWRQKNVLLSI